MQCANLVFIEQTANQERSTQFTKCCKMNHNHLLMSEEEEVWVQYCLYFTSKTGFTGSTQHIFPTFNQHIAKTLINTLVLLSLSTANTRHAMKTSQNLTEYRKDCYSNTFTSRYHRPHVRREAIWFPNDIRRWLHAEIWGFSKSNCSSQHLMVFQIYIQPQRGKKGILSSTLLDTKLIQSRSVI